MHRFYRFFEKAQEKIHIFAVGVMSHEAYTPHLQNAIKRVSTSTVRTSGKAPYVVREDLLGTLLLEINAPRNKRAFDFRVLNYAER